MFSNTSWTASANTESCWKRAQFSLGELSIDEIDLINSVRSAAANDAKVTRDLAEAIVSSGFINERLEDRISSRVRQYVEERATELEAQAELSVRDEKALLEQLRAEREVIQDDLMRKADRGGGLAQDPKGRARNATRKGPG